MADSESNGQRALAVAVLIATLLTIAFNSFAGAGYVGGVTPKVISDKYPVVITPATYAFSIWSLIYLGLVGFSIFQLFKSNLARFTRVRVLYIVSCILNCLWIFLWHNDQIGWCLAVIFALWATLLLVNIRLGCCGTMAETWLLQAPFGIYFGWVTAASLVNLAIFLKYIGSGLADSVAFGSILIAVAGVAAVAARLTLRNFFYPLAIAWAATAIAVEKSGTTALVVTAALVVVVCLITTGSFVTLLKDSTNR